MKNQTENKILESFLFNNKLKFNEIEKLTKIRSNKLSYHIKYLQNENIVTKEGEYYTLSKTAEKIIPYLSNKKAVLPIILIHLGDKEQAFLYKREKRPFKDYLSLPGGRLLNNESIEEATKRMMKDKFDMDVELKKINSISLEFVKRSKEVIHSFLLIFVTAKTRRPIKLIDLKKNRKKIIKSDYEILKNDLDKKIDIKLLNSRP